MGKSLLSRLRKVGNGFRNAKLILAGTALFGLAGCTEQCTPVPPNEPPEITSAPINLTVNEGERINYDVNATDSDGDALHYSISLSGASINPTTGIGSWTTPQVDLDTPFDFEVGVSDGVNPTVTQSGSVLVKNVIPSDEDYVDISGRLEDCENDGIARQGVIRVRNRGDNSILGEYNINGNFSITLDKLVSELPNGVTLEVITGTSANPTSFTRIINLPAGDHNPISDLRANPAIRPVPFYSDFDNDGYADLDSNKDGIISQTEKENFVEHMWRVNFWNGGLQKWNRGELPDDSSTTYSHPTFKGIQISNSFTSEEQDIFENIIRNSGYENAGEINITRGDNHYLELGWGFVRLSNTGEAPGTYVYEQYGSDGYIERFLTNLDHLQVRYEGLVNHEISHGLLYPGHADSDVILALFNSIMKFTSYDARYSPPERPDTFTSTDTKGNYLIDDPTHLGNELEENILGTEFY